MDSKLSKTDAHVQARRALYAVVHALNREALLKVLRHLTVSEAHRLINIVEHAGAHEEIDSAEIAQHQTRFLRECSTPGVSKLREALEKVHGADSVEKMLYRDRWLAIANKVSPSDMAGFLSHEIPTTAAAMLAHFPPRYVADVLGALPEKLRLDIIRQYLSGSRLGLGDSAALLEAVESITFSEGGLPTTRESREGVEFAAQVLNCMDWAAVEKDLERLRQEVPAPVEELEAAMFHFEDLLRLDNRTLQMILSEVKELKKLALALKGLPNESREVILSALAEEARASLKEEMDLMGRVPLHDVQAARQEISALALRLDREGKIRIRGGEDLVE